VECVFSKEHATVCYARIDRDADSLQFSMLHCVNRSKLYS
jgi:hypothetical protein